MINRTIILFSVVIIIMCSWVQSSGSESERALLLKKLKHNIQLYYSAVNKENREGMYSFESEEYKREHSLAEYRPVLLEMKKGSKFEGSRFDRLSVSSVELENNHSATVTVDFLIFNKMEKTWYGNGSFLQSWKYEKDKWVVEAPPKIMLLGED